MEDKILQLENLILTQIQRINYLEMRVKHLQEEVDANYNQLYYMSDSLCDCVNKLMGWDSDLTDVVEEEE